MYISVTLLCAYFSSIYVVVLLLQGVGHIAQGNQCVVGFIMSMLVVLYYSELW